MKHAANRSPFLDSKWKTYTAAGAAAAAAGLVGNAQAAITFLDFNDTVVTDTAVGDLTWADFSVNFNGDAQADILVSYRAFSATTGTANVFPAPGATSGVVGFISANFNYPSRLPVGASIGPSAAFIAVTPTAPQGGRGDMAWGPGYSLSQWVAGVADPPATGFLGVRFLIGANTHFGWVRVTAAPGSHQVTVHDAAFETTPDTGIVAGATGIPEPGGLGLLALGGAGLTAMRRRRKLSAE